MFSCKALQMSALCKRPLLKLPISPSSCSQNSYTSTPRYAHNLRLPQNMLCSDSCCSQQLPIAHLTSHAPELPCPWQGKPLPPETNPCCYRSARQGASQPPAAPGAREGDAACRTPLHQHKIFTVGVTTLS